MRVTIDPFSSAISPGNIDDPAMKCSLAFIACLLTAFLVANAPCKQTVTSDPETQIMKFKLSERWSCRAR